MSSQPNGYWTEERIRLLKELAKLGSNTWIAKQINERTGARFTRNAIIGKRSREGIEWCHQGPRTDKPPRPKKLTMVQRARITTRVKFEGGEITPPEFIGVSLLDLGQNACRFPKGGNDGLPILFCGQPVMEGSSYCEYCHNVCWVPAKRSSERKTFAATWVAA